MADYSQFRGLRYERIPHAEARGSQPGVNRALLAGGALVLIFALAMIWSRPQAAQTLLPLPAASKISTVAPPPADLAVVGDTRPATP